MIETLTAFMATPVGSGLVIGAVTLWPLWRMFRRAGLSPVWSLLVFLPLIGLAAVLGALLFQKWPVVRPGGVPHPQAASAEIRQSLRKTPHRPRGGASTGDRAG